MKIAALMFKIELKMGIALEMTKEQIQNIEPIAIQSAQVNVLCTLTWSGRKFRMIVMYMN